MSCGLAVSLRLWRPLLEPLGITEKSGFIHVGARTNYMNSA